MPKRGIKRKAKTVKRPKAPAAKRRKTSGKRPRARSHSSYSAVGRRLGSLMGPAGGLLGAALGGAADGVIRGVGDYQIKSNSIMMGNSPPSIQNASVHNGSGSVIIRHKEYICDILGSVAFRNGYQFVINPGKPSFPWLQNIALQYQEYRLRGLAYEYRPTSGYAVSGDDPAIGVVIISTQYDVVQPPFATKRDMENTDFCSTGPAYRNVLHFIECARDQSPIQTLYVTNAVGEGIDARWNDFCRVEVATQGMPADDHPVGELWMTYEVELLKPRLTVLQQNGSSYYGHWYGVETDTSTNNVFGNPATTAPLTARAGTNFSARIIGRFITIPDWAPADDGNAYVVICNWKTTLATYNPNLFFVTTGDVLKQIRLLPYWNAGNDWQVTNPQNSIGSVVASSLQFAFTFKWNPAVSDPTTLTLEINPSSVVQAAVADVDVLIVQIPSNSQ